MASIEIALLDNTRCRVRHAASGEELVTDVTPEFGGGGTSFSSTDLVGVALGTCIGSSIAPVAVRERIPLDQVAIVVEKTLLTDPKRIGSLKVIVTIPSGLTVDQDKKLRRAAATCAVHRSVGTTIDIEVSFEVR